MKFINKGAWQVMVNTLTSPRASAGVIVCGFFLLLLLTFGFASPASAQTPSGSGAEATPQATSQAASQGQATFTQMCTGCHTIGGGDRIGPDLKNITQQRDPQWIKSFISDPTSMLASDPAAQQLLKQYNNYAMPNLNLSADQVDQLVAFLSNPGALPAAAAPVLAGGSQNGKLLFTGESSLANGGPPCMACHSVSGVGSMGGGGLGPDLTHVVQRLSEAGLGGALKTIAFPTMIGPFQNRPLTDQEQADLVAFLKQADISQAPVAAVAAGAFSRHALLIFAIGLDNAAILFIVLAFFWARIKKRFTPRLPSRRVQ